MRLERGIFTLSFDLELIWGTLDLRGVEAFGERCLIEKQVVIDRTLGILSAAGVSATWLTVGHLFLDRCERVDGRKHPEIVRPRHAWVRGDWFDSDPDGVESQAPVFLGRSMLERILACPMPQEVGCHGFSHVIFGDAGCSEATAESELAACVAAARPLGLTPRSFAFPRNQVGHAHLLRRHGFVCYRGLDPSWYHGWPAPLRRAAHLGEFLLRTEPPTVVPERAPDGLWNIPGSMIYLPIHGVRKHVPVSARVARAKKGIDAAIRQRRIFHLWTHPTNLVDEMDAMLDGLREILAYAERRRRDGVLATEPMASIAEAAEREWGAAR